MMSAVEPPKKKRKQPNLLSLPISSPQNNRNEASSPRQGNPITFPDPTASNSVGSPEKDHQWKEIGLDGIRQPSAFAGSGSIPGPQDLGEETSESSQVILGGMTSLTQETQEIIRRAKRTHEEQMARLHIIMLQILMGDVAGAVRSYGMLMDRDTREFGRAIVKKLDQIRRSRSLVIMRYAMHGPPQPYLGEDPARITRYKKASDDYTQYSQLSTQLMGELQNTERELIDILHNMRRDLNGFWQSYTSMRDQDARTTERVMTVR